MYVCIYVCMHACMLACMHVCMSILFIYTSGINGISGKQDPGKETTPADAIDVSTTLQMECFCMFYDPLPSPRCNKPPVQNNVLEEPCTLRQPKAPKALP